MPGLQNLLLPCLCLFQKNAYDYEHSELLLYQNMVIQESGDIKSALEHLEQYKDQICDKVTWLETKGNQLLLQKSNADAAQVFRTLIDRNPENHTYYFRLLEALEANSTDQRLSFFDEYKNKFPKAQTPQRLPLDFAQGEAIFSSSHVLERELVDK